MSEYALHLKRKPLSSTRKWINVTHLSRLRNYVKRMGGCLLQSNVGVWTLWGASWCLKLILKQVGLNTSSTPPQPKGRREEERRRVDWKTPRRSFVSHRFCRGPRFSSKTPPIVPWCCSHLHSLILWMNQSWHSLRMPMVSCNRCTRFCKQKITMTTWLQVQAN